MALNEFQMDYELTEALGSGREPSYSKHPDLLKYNPKGLVPTLVFPDGRVLCESIGILKELGKEVTEKDDASLTSDHLEAIEWNRRICSPFYRVLMKPTAEEREQGWIDMSQGLAEFSEHLEEFYDSKSPGLVDFAVFPFVHRLYILEHYKGFSLRSGNIKDSILAWQEKMESRPAVAKTLANREELLAIYQRYADGTAKSQVGEAVRKGKEAHDV